MKVQLLAYATILVAAFSVVAIPVNSDQSVTAARGAAQGRLELECNLSDVVLYLCPKDNFSRKTVRRFFGLVKSQKDECSKDQLFLGTTPFMPVSLPAGRFVLLIPPQFSGEHEEPIEILIQPEKKTFLMLKLLRISSNQQNSWPHGGDSEDRDGSGGTGSAGGVGTGAPN